MKNESMKNEIRLYTAGGEKFFAPFDPDAFLDTFQRLLEQGGGTASNAALEAALYAATGGKTCSGQRYDYATLEIVGRDPETGLTLPFRPPCP